MTKDNFILRRTPTLLDKLESLSDGIFKSEREIDNILMKESPKVDFFPDALGYIMENLYPSSNRIREIVEQRHNEVLKQQKNVSELEKERIQIIEEYSQGFEIINDATHLKKPFSKYTENMYKKAEKFSEKYFLLGKFDPKEFLLKFPELDSFSPFFDTTWRISSQYASGEINYHPQIVFGKPLKNIKTISQSNWRRIERPAGRLHDLSIDLERHLESYDFHKKEYERKSSKAK